jgi:hypothetical protein
LTGEPDGFGAILGFSDHFQSRLGLQQTPQTISKNRVVVGDEDAYGL